MREALVSRLPGRSLLIFPSGRGEFGSRRGGVKANVASHIQAKEKRNLKAVILAAGEGRRFRAVGDVKPLTPLHGVQLIEHVISLVSCAGIKKIGVVTGYRADTLEEALAAASRSIPVDLQFIRNENWRLGNGTSVLAAERFVDGPFILLMADHLFDSTIVSDLLARELAEDGVILAVDQNLSNPLVDLDDVTRVSHEGQMIKAIGKHISDYNAFDTGIFYSSPTLFRALKIAKDEGLAESGSLGLSHGMQVMANWGKAQAFDIDGRFWIDIDDEHMFEKAKQMRSQLSETALA